MTDAIGWLGTLLIVSAYAGNSWGLLSSTDRRYQVLNLLGAVAVGVNVATQKAWPALTLQVIWGIIALVSLKKR